MPPDARLGSVLADRWRLERVLGTGGMATVYAALHRNGSQVAIKIPHERDPESLARFLKEGYLGNRVDHPGVVKTLDDGVTDDGAPFLVMELVTGESLHERLDREGALRPDDAVRITDAILDALGAAHAAGVVHRDVKPSNVLLTREGGVKILDFGIARERTTKRGASETVAGAVLGTPSYMAPEQALGRTEEVDAHTDVWAAGATLFATLTNRDLRHGNTPGERYAAALLPVPPMRELAPELPPALAAVLDRALAYDPRSRFASAKDMQLALRDAGLSRRVETDRPRPPHMRRAFRWPTKAKILGAGAVLVSVLTVGLAVLASRDDRDDARAPSFLPPVPGAASASVVMALVSAPEHPRTPSPPSIPASTHAISPAPSPAPSASPPPRVRITSTDARIERGSTRAAPAANTSNSTRRAFDPMADRF